MCHLLVSFPALWPLSSASFEDSSLSPTTFTILMTHHCSLHISPGHCDPLASTATSICCWLSICISTLTSPSGFVLLEPSACCEYLHMDVPRLPQRESTLVTQSCLTLWNLTDCSLLCSSVHGISQARIVEWVAVSFSRGSSRPRDRTLVSCIAGGFFTDGTTRKEREREKSPILHPTLMCGPFPHTKKLSDTSWIMVPYIWRQHQISQDRSSVP